MSIEALNSTSNLTLASLSMMRMPGDSSLSAKSLSKNDAYKKLPLNLEKNEEMINRIVFSAPLNEEKNVAFGVRVKINTVKDDSKETKEELIDAEKVNKVLDGTKQAVNIVKGVSNITGIDPVNNAMTTSEGALALSQGIIKLTDVSSQENKTKVVVDATSQVASGLGVILSQIKIPQAEFLTLTGTALGIGTQQQTLAEHIKNKNVRGITETSVGIVKNGWGVTLSGLKAAKVASGMGVSAGIVTKTTLDKISAVSDKVATYTNIVALPFAVAGTGFKLWDLVDANKKVKEIETQVASEPENKQLTKVLEIKKTSADIRTLSFGISVVSTAALISSVVFPQYKGFTNTLAVGASIAGSVTDALASESLRLQLNSGYQQLMTEKKEWETKTYFKLAKFIDRVVA